jgi:hypothetical protein
VAGDPRAVLVWSGTKPRRDEFAIPPEGLVVGRELFETDDEHISRRHTRVTIVDKGIRIEHVGNSNGTFVEGNAQLHEPFVLTKSPRFFRSARSVFVLTTDVEADAALIELPSSLLRMVRARSVQAQLHASAVIEALVVARREGTAYVLDMFSRSVAAWLPRGKPLRADEVSLEGTPATGLPAAEVRRVIRPYPTREDRATINLIEKLESEMGLRLGYEIRPQGRGFVWGDQGVKGRRRFEVDCTWANGDSAPAYNLHLFDDRQKFDRGTQRPLDDAVAILKAWITHGTMP